MMDKGFREAFWGAPKVAAVVWSVGVSIAAVVVLPALLIVAVRWAWGLA